MKNRLIKKALCVALASTMVFGEALQDTVSSGSVHISALGYGTEAVLYVNGAWYDSWTDSDYDGSWHVDTEFRGVAGATYQFKLVVSDDNGQTVSQESGKIYFEAPKFSRSRKPSEYVSYSTGDTGYLCRSHLTATYRMISGMRCTDPQSHQEALRGFCQAPVTCMELLK